MLKAWLWLTWFYLNDPLQLMVYCSIGLLVGVAMYFASRPQTERFLAGVLLVVLILSIPPYAVSPFFAWWAVPFIGYGMVHLALQVVLPDFCMQPVLVIHLGEERPHPVTVHLPPRLRVAVQPRSLTLEDAARAARKRYPDPFKQTGA